MTISERLPNLRTKCEEVFYTLSKDLDKEQAEKVVNSVVISILENEIKVHQEFINSSKSLVEREKLRKLNMLGDYARKSYIWAHEARIETHEKQIELAKFDIEILKLDVV